MVVGQEKISAFFSRVIDQKTLVHAYCFVGQPQVGKRALAMEIAGKLLGISSQKLFTHPDFFIIGRQEDEKTGKLKKEISVAQARMLRDRLSRKPWSGKYQVLILDDAEFLSTEAANALLKVIEEPSEKSVMFLLTENDEVLLPTIRSRVQSFYLPTITEKEICEFLKLQKCNSEQADIIAKNSLGRPGRAQELWRDPKKLTELNNETDRWKRLAKKPLCEQIALLEDLFGDKVDAVRGREKIISVLEIWLMSWREKLLTEPGSDKVCAIDEILRAQKLLTLNIHPRLVIENLLTIFST
jgi:DNA polymerase-3 subunit delta'